VRAAPPPPPNPPPPPPPPPVAVPKAPSPPPPPPAGAPQSLVSARPARQVSAADAMKQALRKKANTRLVERKDEVAALVCRALGELGDGVDAAEGALKELEGAADSLGLPLAAEEWGARLGSIKKKGGDSHFDAAQCARADEAHRRLSSLSTMAAWRGLLRTRQMQADSAAKAACSGEASCSRLQTVERLSESLRLLSKTVSEVTGDSGYEPALREMAARHVPQTLNDDAAAARLSSAALATAAHAVAEKELAGLRAEAALTQRFRAPQTLAVLRAARAVVEQADNFLPSSKREAMRELLELLDAGLVEAGPMVAIEDEEDEDYV